MIFSFFEKRSEKYSPPLSDDAAEHLIKMFELDDQPDAATLLCRVTGVGGSNLTSEECDRCRFAALKLSDGLIQKLRLAVEIFDDDPRELLVQAGFGEDLHAHKKWSPEGFTDKWMSPISLALYSIIFVKGSVPEEHVCSSARGLCESDLDTDRLVRHIEKELLNPSQNVVDILELRCSEDDARDYLGRLIGYLKVSASDKNH